MENAGIAEDSVNPSGSLLVSRRWPSFLRAWPLEAIRSDDAPPAVVYEEWSSSEEERALFQGGALSDDGGRESFVVEVVVAENLLQPGDGQAQPPIEDDKEDEFPPEPRESYPKDRRGESREKNNSEDKLKLGREGSDEVLDTEPKVQVEPAHASADGVSDNEPGGGAGGSDGRTSSKAGDKQSAP